MGGSCFGLLVADKEDQAMKLLIALAIMTIAPIVFMILMGAMAVATVWER